MNHAGDMPPPAGSRERFKHAIARLDRGTPAEGATLLIYHRVGGGTRDELDLAPKSFAAQVRVLAEQDVVSLDSALDRLDAGDRGPSIVLTFDDGFADVYENAWPILRDHRVPFTVYLATGFMGAPMRWEGSTATGESGRGLSWRQLQEMVASGLCTIGNHTHRHVPAHELTVEELDECSAAIERRLDMTPHHFTYPWGHAVPEMDNAMRTRFRSASTGELGRNLPETDRVRLRRVPVRRTDPETFFRAKLAGRLVPERLYGVTVKAAKSLGVRP